MGLQWPHPDVEPPWECQCGACSSVCSLDFSADLPKAVVFLDPPWVRVLQEDHVTLKCQGAHPPGDNSTRWLHNGTLISSQASSYFIAAATVENSGEYRCQTGLSTLSDPVQLDVHTGKLVRGKRELTEILRKN